MSDPDARRPENAPGPYYVDEDCTACATCREIAPAHFAESEDSGQSYVSQQPETDAEQARCAEALGSCPADAIGDDGA